MARENFSMDKDIEAIARAAQNTSEAMREEGRAIREAAGDLSRLSRENIELAKANETLANSFNGISKALKSVSSGSGVEKYWKTQEKLIKQVQDAYDQYHNSYSNSDAEHLAKSVNALKAIDGYSFDNMDASIKHIITTVESMGVKLEEAFTPHSLKEIFSAFEALQNTGLQTREVFKILGNGANLDGLNQQLMEAENYTAELEAKVSSLQEELNGVESGRTITKLKNDIQELQSQIDTMVSHSKQEFREFLNFANINPDRMISDGDDSSELIKLERRVDQLYDKIKNEGMSARDAISKIKSEFGHLIEGTDGASLDNLFDSTQMQNFLTQFESMCHRIEEMTHQISNNFASMFTEALNNPEVLQSMGAGFNQANNSNGIHNVTELANALASKLGEVDGQTSNIIGDFKEILTIIESISKTDLQNLDYMTASFESLKSIGNFNVDSKSLEQLRMALDAISQISNVSNLSYLKNINLDGFKDVKISKASMNNLSEHLSILAKLDINKLQGLSNINLKNFNDLHISKASMEALSSFMDKIKDISQYSNELNNIAQILQSSVSKVDQLHNVVSGDSGKDSAVVSANNLAQQTKQFTSSRELLDKAARELIDTVSSNGAGTTTKTAYQSVEDFYKQNEETTTEIEKVVRTIQDAKGDIAKIDYTTDTVWGLEDVFDKDGNLIEQRTTSTEELTGAVITYRDELGRTIQTQYKWKELLKDTGEKDESDKSIMERTGRFIFAQGKSRIVDKNSNNTDIKKFIDDRKKTIADYEMDLDKMLSRALDKARNKPLSQDSMDEVEKEINDIKVSVENLNNADVSNFLDKTIEIDKRISSISNKIEVLRNADNVTSLNGTSKEDMFDKHESSFRILKQDIKDAGVESEKLTRLLTEIQSVIDKGIDNATSEEIQKIGKEISNARTELGALKKEARPEELIAKKTKPFDELKNINPLNASLYNQEYGDAAQKIDELNQKLRSGTITQKSYGEQVDEIVNKLKLMSITVANVGKNLDKTEVEMKANKLVEQNYSGKQVMPQISTNNKTGITTLTYEWEDEQEQARKLVYEYDRMTGSLRQIGEAQKEVKKGATVWQKIKDSIKHLAKYLLTFGSFYKIVAAIKQGITYVKELDDSLTEMKKVSDETTQSLKNFQKASFDIADSIGATAKAIQDSTADFMRLGYSIDEASKLAKDANIYANVGDMEIDEATEHMISSIKAWSSEFSSEVEASSAIIDRYNEIGNNFAITSADIGSAMERSAAALKAGGNTLNESLGLITAGNIIQQDADTTANALKVLSLRIRGSKADLEEMGEETDGLASSTSKLRSEIKGLTGVDIMLDENTYKSTAQIIQEIGAVWDKLSDVSQAATLEKLAGKTRASVVAGLLENYDIIDDVIKSAEGADGSALEENEKYLDSMQGKINQLTNHIQEFWSTLLDSEVLKTLIDVLDVLVQKATQFIDSWAFFPTILGGIGAAISIKKNGGGRVKMFALSNMPPNRLAERCASSGVCRNGNICFLLLRIKRIRLNKNRKYMLLFQHT